MAMIAQCLVSDPDLMILDEPMNNLDLRRELDIFEIIRKEHSERELTTGMVLHDLNFAARYSDSVIVLCDGQVYSHGTPAEVITPEMLRDVYKVEAEVMINSKGFPVIDPVRSIRRCRSKKRSIPAVRTMSVPHPQKIPYSQAFDIQGGHQEDSRQGNADQFQ